MAAISGEASNDLATPRKSLNQKGLALAGLLLTTAIPATTTAHAQDAQSGPHAGETVFSIPAGPVSSALTALGRQAGVRIDVPPGASARSPAISGPMNLAEALARVLQGTGLTYHLANGVVVVEPVSDAADPGAVAAAAAAATEEGVLVLDPIVVTASGFAQRIKDAPASISIITREDLEKKAFSDLTDALREAPGVTVTGASNTKDIFIRGLPGQYTLILVDGKRQSTRQTRTNGDAGFEQNFIPPLEAIDRIEVVRGPMSSLYGSDAMGGVINIITRKVAKKWTGSISAEATLQQHNESGNSGQARFYTSGPVIADLLGMQVWGRFYDRAEDDIIGGFTGARDADIAGKLTFTPTPDQDIILQGGITGVRRDASPGESAELSDTDTYNEHERRHWSLSHTGRWSWATTDFSISQEHTQRRSYDADGFGRFVRDSRSPEILNTVIDGKVAMPFATALGHHSLVVGGQWQDGVLTDHNPGRREETNEEFSIWQQALFVEDEWRLSDRFAITGGVRLDDHEIYGSHWSPRAYAVWHATDQWTLKGGWSTGFRAPDIRTIAPGYAYTTGGANCSYGPNGTCGVIIGDPNLKPETSSSYELSASWDGFNGFTAGVTLFHTEFKDKVASTLVYNEDGTPARWEEDPNYRLYYSYNIDDAVIRGVEITANWAATETLSFKAGYTYTDSEQKTGTYAGLPLARTPEHLATLRADWITPIAGLTAWAAAEYHGEEINAGLRVGSNGDPVMDGDKVVGRQYDNYTLVDVGASYAVTDNFTINAAVYNVFDKRLDPATFDTAGDGRRLWIGTNTKF